MADMLTIKQTVERAKAEGLPVSDYTLRRWIKAGLVPVRHAGMKNLIYYPNLVRYLQCADGGDIAPANVADGTENSSTKWRT